MTEERIELLGATPKTLAHLVVEATDEQLDRVAQPGEWPARVVLAHLRDCEFLSLRVWLERALGEPEPAVGLFDNQAWLIERNRRRDRKDHLLADFALQRQASLAILRSLRDADWGRTLSAPGLGRFTVSALVDAWLEHDREHVAQLERALGETLAEVQARRAAWAASYPRRPGTPGA